MTTIKFFLTLSMSLTTIISCSKKDEPFKASAGIYQLTNKISENNNNEIFIKVTDNQLTRYSVNPQDKSYTWEIHLLIDKKINGRAKLTKASCQSENKNKLNSIQDFSKYNFKSTNDGFLLNDNLFKKLSAHEASQLMGQLTTYTYNCGEADQKTTEELIQTTAKILYPKMLPTDQLPPLISGTVLKSLNTNGQDYYVVYSEKSYQTYQIYENRVSWTYGELKDGKLTGKTIKLQKSCPEGHPLREDIGKTKKASTYEITEDESNPKVVKIGDKQLEKLTAKEWQVVYEQILKSEVVCNAVFHAER